jgi:general secretion pathway protein C
MKFDIHYLLTARYAKWIIISLISLLTVLIIGEFASLFVRDARTSTSADSSPVVVIPKENSNFILNSSLFGIYVPSDLNEGAVKKSMLNVTLVGILLADKDSESQVIIRSASGEEKTYKIGDKIPGDASVERIMAWGVLVEHNGTLESLSLPKNDLVFEPVPKPLKEE